MDAVIRLQRYHGPVVRIRAEWNQNEKNSAFQRAHYLNSNLELLARHCREVLYYDEYNYYVEDGALSGLVSAIRDLADIFGINNVAAEMKDFVIAPMRAPQARDRLKIVKLPACKQALNEWCKLNKIDSPLPEAKPTLDVIAPPPATALSGTRYMISCDYLTVIDTKKKQTHENLGIVTQLALEHMVTTCPDRTKAVKGGTIIVAVKQMYEKRLLTKLSDGYKNVVHFFRMSSGKGTNRKQRYPFYGKLIRNNGREGMYWLEANDAPSQR